VNRAASSLEDHHSSATSSSSRILSFEEMKHVGLQIVQISFLLILEGLVMRTGSAGKEVSLERGKAGGALSFACQF
jgi:hypothetical protein